MNILMLHPHDIYSSSEPWTIRIRRIADEFAKKGHFVRLVYFPLNGEAEYRKKLDGGIEVYSMSRRTGFFNLLRNIIKTVKLSQGCDVIHLQKCHYYASLPALIAAFIARKPLHYDWDDWETKIFYYSNPRQRVVGEFINLYEQLIPKIADTVSVSSRCLRDLCLKRGTDFKHIFSAPVGAELKRTDKGHNYSDDIKNHYNISGPLILYVGQLHGGQYAELFIKAAHIVIESGFDATFIIVGGGYKMIGLKKLAAQLNISNSCVFTGAVAHDMVYKYIIAADICIACFADNDITRCKSPLKIAEYLACGKPIIASNVGEIRNMVGGVGMLVEPGNPKSLAYGIMDLLKDDDLRNNLREWGKERVKRKYNWTVTANSILKAYAKGLEKQKALPIRR